MRARSSSPGFAARQLAATACWIRSSEELLGGERPAITHAYDWPWSHGAAAVLLADRRGGKSMISLFGDVLPHLDELNQFDSVSRPFHSTSRAVLRRADLVASMTQHCRRLVRHVGLRDDEVALVRVLGDMRPFNPNVDGSPVRRRPPRRAARSSSTSARSGLARDPRSSSRPCLRSAAATPAPVSSSSAPTTSTRTSCVPGRNVSGSETRSTSPAPSATRRCPSTTRPPTCLSSRR